MTALDKNWVSWAAENVALGVTDSVITDIMVKAGIPPPDIHTLVGKIKQLPGYAALDRMTQKYKALQAEIGTPKYNAPIITYYSDALPLELITEANEYIQTQTSSRTNYSCWDKTIVRSSNVVLVYDLPNELHNKIKIRVKELVPSIQGFEFVHAMYQRWMPGSYIPWHSDYSWKFGVTIYLNDVWDENWGGYFAYKEGQDIKCIKPEFNKASYVYMPVDHMVFSTTPDAPARNTIQIFGK